MRSTICIVLAIIFALISIVCYSQSTQELDRYSSSVLGTNSVMNLQATILFGVFAILSILCLIGAFILSTLSDLHYKLQEIFGSFDNTDNYSDDTHKSPSVYNDISADEQRQLLN